LQTNTFDVLIIGAGLSGIGAAAHLQKRCPAKTYAILEARGAIGGTWDLFRYPGVRSDSDMFTLGYRFKPWTDQKAIADGPSILSYVRQTADEYAITPHIRFNHKLVSANWDSSTALWALECLVDGQPQRFTCRFLWMCAGYYKYDAGYRPPFPNEQSFTGQILHPQFWPESLDFTGKRIVVIGSGATAVTLVPALAEKAAHVTMLQRSPSFMFSAPAEDALANTTRKVLPAKLAYAVTRWRKILFQQISYKTIRKYPAAAKRRLIELIRAQLPEGFDVKKHFTPRYNPWDQRVCLTPDGDLFNAIKAGKAGVVTDDIDRFTPQGILLKSGKELAADIIVTATGLTLDVAGGAALSVDQKPVVYAKTFVYKGLMYADVPNFASVFGYINASWTLRADLISAYVCRLLRHMDRHHLASATPRQTDPAMVATPFWEFSSSYVSRANDALPKQGPIAPWRQPQDYLTDVRELRFGKIDDGVLEWGPEQARDTALNSPSPQS
jgi:cation diffusion facilitator CzcD-associated flavoprotein CzcO